MLAMGQHGPGVELQVALALVVQTLKLALGQTLHGLKLVLLRAPASQ